MQHNELTSIRLQNQHLASPTFQEADDVVKWFGAVQAQDYLGSLWAIGMRMKRANEKIIEEAIAKRTIVRSWPMRGTLHFTHAQDIRWMLKLLAARVMKRNAFRYRELELTDETFRKSGKVFSKALVGGKQMTREKMLSLLEENGISPSGQRGIHILGYLSMQGLLCLGSREGKQFTFTLLDEWIPPAKSLEPDHALAELTKRYFTSHGPATIKDFVWWSGLTVTEAKNGIEMIKSFLIHETIDGQTYWMAPVKQQLQTKSAYLLPAYDEYTVAYKDRSAIIESNHYIQAGNGLKPTIVIDGRIVGTWRRELKKHQVFITPHFFYDVTKTDVETFHQAAQKYASFLERKLELVY